MLYKAFMSYSHAADGKLASALQSALHQFARPWYKLRALQVFRDETNLATNPHLWSTIEQALNESEYFILLAAPGAAQSAWVPKETAHWLKNRSPDTLLIVLTDGELVWDSTAGDFDWAKTTALPSNLTKVFDEEPLYLDFRSVRTQADLSLHNPEFLNNIARLAATLHGRKLEELIGEDVRQHRKFKLFTRSMITALTALLLITAVLAIWANRERGIAVSRQREAETERNRAERQREETLNLIVQVVNKTARFGIDRFNFEEETNDVLSTLVSHLGSTGFKGTIRIEGHLPRFCVVYENKAEERFHLAPDDLPINRCSFFPSSEAYGLVLAEKRAKELRRLLQSFNLPDIKFSVVSYGNPIREESEVIRTARDWNRRAMRYNKAHIILQPQQN